MQQEKTKPLYTGHRKRLSEEVLGNLSRTPDYKLLELLLTYSVPRRDMKPAAKAMLKAFGSLRGVMDAAREDLLEIPGIGAKPADLGELLHEIHARYEEAPLVRKVRLCNNKSVAAMARARLAGLKVEELWIALIDTGLHLIRWECVTRGTLNAAYVNIPEIIRLCLTHHAWGFILVHNHPGGGRPSAQDVTITQQIEAAANAAGICLLEHLIIMDNDYCGLREEHILPPLSPQKGNR